MAKELQVGVSQTFIVVYDLSFAMMTSSDLDNGSHNEDNMKHSYRQLSLYLDLRKKKKTFEVWSHWDGNSVCYYLIPSLSWQIHLVWFWLYMSLAIRPSHCFLLSEKRKKKNILSKCLPHRVIIKTRLNNNICENVIQIKWYRYVYDIIFQW